MIYTLYIPFGEQFDGYEIISSLPFPKLADTANALSWERSPPDCDVCNLMGSFLDRSLGHSMR